VYLITQGGPGGATRLYALRTYELIGSLRYGQAVAVAMLVVAMLVVAMLVVAFYAMAQRFLVEGLTAGSVKG
jgi:ABC-type sugar transport system permease subunit